MGSGPEQKAKRPNKFNWVWSFPPCRNNYTAEASKCSYLAPFDNKMNLIMNIAVGGQWGNVDKEYNNIPYSLYDAFDQGVEMEVSDVVVYYAAKH